AYGRPATFRFEAIATDSDGSVRQVRFLDGGITLGADAISPYELTMMNPFPGNHVLRAEATDNAGYVSTSAPVSITITEPQGGAVWNVDIQGAKFDPGLLRVTAGDTVVFRNLDPANHTATGVFAGREALCGSTVLDAAHSCTNTFLVPGSYAYFCGLHPFTERATVVVSQAAVPLRLVSPGIAATGGFQFTLTTTPGRTYVIQGASNLPPRWVSLLTNVASANFLRFDEGGAASSNRLRCFRAFVAP
ncbi:MAG: Ig-like domain-containing protein, partial [Gammaproteobacteria bacterium]